MSIIDFQDGCRRHLGFVKFIIFYGRNGQGVRNASPCQIWRKSVGPRLRYGDFSIFQDGGRRHLGFWKFRIFNGRGDQEGRTASSCQISSKSVKPRPKYGDFSIFSDGGRRHHILNFRNFKFLTVGTVKRVELRHRAKLRWNRPKRGRDIAIYRFFKMVAAAILDFKNF